MRGGTIALHLLMEDPVPDPLPEGGGEDAIRTDPVYPGMEAQGDGPEPPAGVFGKRANVFGASGFPAGETETHVVSGVGLGGSVFQGLVPDRHQRSISGVRRKAG